MNDGSMHYVELYAIENTSIVTLGLHRKVARVELLRSFRHLRKGELLSPSKIQT